ncbi:hypothetical protein RJ495_005107 [Pluralibacter gergoviae]|nr:hypothetical protein [Pluralibacter gergoviae]ELD4303993.1 hypothetical protein [Pluralibacter gergoviae]
MGFIEILTVGISLAALLWSIYRDRSDDMDEVIDRIVKLESTSTIHTSDITRLEKKQDEFSETVEKLQAQIHQLDLKIERILTILEGQNKGS